MKYLIQVRFNGADAVIRGLPDDEQNKITAEFQAVRTLSGVLDGNQLEPPGTAKTIRVNDGQTLVNDGPAVDDGAAIDGYYILEGPDLETAIGFAARIPVARMGGTVEVRALMERQ
jgi:hypothetical protein